MLRTQISLTDQERRRLDTVAQQTGRSISSLIREAVERTWGDERNFESDLAAMRRGFGAWKNHDESGATYVLRLRGGARLRQK